MMIVNAKRYPALYKAMLDIKLDTGAGHVGTTHPSGWDAKGKPVYQPIDLSQFEVPEDREPLIAPSEAALSALLAESPEEFETLCCGDEADMEEIRDRSEGFTAAHRLLNAFFDDWSEDTP